MPNMINDVIWNETTYDIHDKRISSFGAGLTLSAGGELSVSFPIADASTLGCVKIGSNINVAADGTISVAAPYSLPQADASTLGGIKVGSGLSIDANGVLSATGGGSYTLPAATTTTLGGIIVGTGLSIDNSGVLSATGGGSYVLPAATTTTLGGVIVGNNLTVDANGTVDINYGEADKYFEFSDTPNTTFTMATSFPMDSATSDWEAEYKIYFKTPDVYNPFNPENTWGFAGQSVGSPIIKLGTYNSATTDYTGVVGFIGSDSSEKTLSATFVKDTEYTIKYEVGLSSTEIFVDGVSIGTINETMPARLEGTANTICIKSIVYNKTTFLPFFEMYANDYATGSHPMQLTSTGYHYLNSWNTPPIIIDLGTTGAYVGGNQIGVTGNVISYYPSISSQTELGSVKVGSGLSIDEYGALSAIVNGGQGIKTSRAFDAFSNEFTTVEIDYMGDSVGKFVLLSPGGTNISTNVTDNYKLTLIMRAQTDVSEYLRKCELYSFMYTTGTPIVNMNDGYVSFHGATSASLSYEFADNTTYTIVYDVGTTSVDISINGESVGTITGSMPAIFDGYFQYTLLNAIIYEKTGVDFSQYNIEVDNYNVGDTITGLGTVIEAGSNRRAAYVGTNGINISNNGTVSLGIASANALGGIKVGTGLSIDANGILSATGGGSYTLPAATSSTLGGVKVGSSLKIDSNDVLDVNYTIFTDTTNTTATIPLNNNHEVRYTQELTSLTVNLPSPVPDNYIAWLVFPSGSTATSMTYANTIKWSGDDVTSNVFVPAASKTYNICFWYDGINVNAVARGV